MIGVSGWVEIINADAPWRASFLRHGCLHHHFSICCSFVKILSAAHNFGHSYHPTICQTVPAFLNFGHFGPVLVLKSTYWGHPLSVGFIELCHGDLVCVRCKCMWFCDLFVVGLVEECANYCLAISPICFFSQMGVVPTQITCVCVQCKCVWFCICFCICSYL